jgi:hypothetical protein
VPAMLPIKVNVSSSGGIQPNVKRRFFRDGDGGNAPGI